MRWQPTRLIEALFEFNPTNLGSNDVWKILLSSKNKKIELTWPYPVMEIYFDFIESEEKVFTEWFEYYENETNEEIITEVVKYI